MANSGPVTAGTKATVLIQGSPGTGLPTGAGGYVQPGPSGWFQAANGTGATIYLGGPNVTSSNGYSIATSGTLNGYIWPSDTIYCCTSSGSSTVTVLVTGKAGIA